MTLRVGIVGCGFVAGLHSRGLRELIRTGAVDANVVGTADSDLARAEAFASAHGARLATIDPSEVLAAVDVAWICTPTNTHRLLVEQAAAAGVAVYCEKPLAPNLADAEAMARAVRDAQLPSQVGLVLRSSPVLQAIPPLLVGGRVGRPMTAVLRDDQFFPIQGQYASTWRSQVDVAGGGTLLEHSIHDLDVLAWLLGRVTAVSARTANFAGHAGIEDTAVVTLEHASGAISTLISVWHGVLSRPSTRRLEVFCERALIWLDAEHRGPLHVESEPASEAPDIEDPGIGLDGLGPWRDAVSLYARAARDFLDAVATGRPPFPGFDVALDSHRVADAAYRSSASGGIPVAV